MPLDSIQPEMGGGCHRAEHGRVFGLHFLNVGVGVDAEPGAVFLGDHHFAADLDAVDLLGAGVGGDVEDGDAEGRGARAGHGLFELLGLFLRGEVEFMAEDLETWAQVILDGYPFWTGYPLAHDWQALHGPLKRGHRLSPKIPFVMGGDYKVDFLYSIPSIEAMRFRASMAMQIRNLPDGSKVKLIVKGRL
jgi:hypothetical protein